MKRWVHFNNILTNLGYDTLGNYRAWSLTLGR